MRKKILMIWLLCLGISSVAQEVPRGIFFGQTPVKARFNDVLDIFGDKMALYDPEDNMLILQDGFNYRLPEGFVTFNTGAPLRIRLAGRVYMEAAVLLPSLIPAEMPNGVSCPEIRHLRKWATMDGLSPSAAMTRALRSADSNPRNYVVNDYKMGYRGKELGYAKRE